MTHLMVPGRSLKAPWARGLFSGGSTGGHSRADITDREEPGTSGQAHGRVRKLRKC